MQPGRSVSGIISLKHVYEIANFKIKDINCAHLDLKEMCVRVLNTASRCGIKVVKHDIDPEELAEFLDKRKELEKKELQELSEKKAAKMMRAAATSTTTTGAKK